ncbi:MAG: SH3 domain-containing protein [Pseudomonadota bacterium]
MKRSMFILSGMALLVAGAGAAELAYTVRPTEMKAKPFSDAAVVHSLAESSKVDVLQRQASWMQVKAEKSTGWVKMLSLRFDAVSGAPKAGGASSNLSVLMNIASTGTGGSTPTTGVRGISEEALKNPHANPVQLRQLNELTLAPGELDAFAKTGKLSSKTMEFLPTPVAAVKTPETGAKK